MNLKSICLLPVLLFSFAVLTAQNAAEYVDVREAKITIAKLERANTNHRQKITANTERKSFLENRIQLSANRLTRIQENLDFAHETNRELNALNRETEDKETKDRLNSSRNKLLSVIWILTTEQETLMNQKTDDEEEVAFLTRDSSRRESLIIRNAEKIAPMQQSVAATEAKINEISSKLDTIVDKLDELREEVTTSVVQ